jgi:hypothetical protein
MKINEIILEQEQLDELSLKGLGTSLGKVPAAIAGAAFQGAKNVWNGAKQGFQAGQNALKPDDTASTQSSTTGSNPQVTSNTTDPQTGGQTNTRSSSDTASTQSAPADNSEVDQILQSIEPLDPASKQEIVKRIQAEPATNTASNPQNNNQANPQSTVTPKAKADPFGSVVNSLNTFAPPETTSSGGTLKQTTTGQVHKANPNNPNNTPAPATATQNVTPAQTTSVQQPAKPSNLKSKAKKVKVGTTSPSQAELDADHARLASGTNEGFYSRFLGTNI